MEPQGKAARQDNHKAIFQVEYVAHPNAGDVTAELHVITVPAEMMKLKAVSEPVHVTDAQLSNPY